MSDQEFIIAPATVEVDFNILPLDTAMNSLIILNQVEELSGLGEWVESTYEALTPEQRHTNKLLLFHVLEGLYPEEPLEDFPAFLQHVRTVDPETARDKVIGHVLKKCESYNVEIDVDAQALLNDKALYLETIDRAFREAYARKGHEIDLSIYEEVYDLLQDPPAMKQLVVDHLTFMWEDHLKDEWKRTLPLLKETVEAFGQIDFSSQTVLEAMRAVTGRDMSEYWSGGDLEAQKVVFVPSAHIGPYNAFFKRDDTVYIFFGARLPKGVRIASPALSRSELLVRLSALADDTRLTILELLTQHQELCAQDIIEMLNLSQSSASRHLRQLTATGYLVERRRDVAKCYSLNIDRMEDTMRALKHFMGG